MRQAIVFGAILVIAVFAIGEVNVGKTRPAWQPSLKVQSIGEQAMLILGRHVGETLIIGGDIVVTILSVQGSNVRIGIEAPKSVEVYREEIYQRIQLERDSDPPI